MYRITVLTSFETEDKPDKETISKLEDSMEAGITVYAHILGGAGLTDGFVSVQDTPGAWDYVPTAK